MGCMLLWAAGAMAVRLCDYTSPETNLSDLGLSFSYRYFDDGATPGVDASGGRAGVQFSQLNDGRDMGFTLSGGAEVTLNGLAPTAGLGDVAGTFRYYLHKETPLFAFGGFAASLSTGQPQPGVDVRAGVGYGRFSDVTPLAKAVTIDKELREARALSKPLPDATLGDVAAAIGRRAEYASVEELVAHVVDIIQTASQTTIAPRQVLMVEDAILATGDELYCGWAIQAGLGYELIDPYGGSKDFLITGSADAAFAPNPESQLLFRGSISGPFRILEENTLSVRVSYDWAISATSTLLAAYNLQRVQPLGLDASASHALSLLMGFVVGKTDFGVQLALSKASSAPAWTIEVSVSAALDVL